MGVVALHLALGSGRRRVSDRLLAGFLVSLALTLLNFLYMASDLVRAAPVFAYLGNTLGLSAAPLLYLYAKSLSREGFRLRTATLAHFAPVAAVLALVVVNYTFRTESEQLDLLRGVGPEGLLGSLTVRVLIFGFVLAYLGATLFIVARYAVLYRAFFSAVDGELSWLRISVIGAIVLWLSSLAHQVAIEIWPSPELDRAFVVVMALSAFLLGCHFLVRALRQSQAPALPLPAEAPSTAKYGEQRLSVPELERLAEVVEAHLGRTEAHRAPGLSLGSLSADLPMTERELSQVLNRHYQQSFFDFVNSRRIRWACERLLADPEASVTSVMLDSGFTSKSSFYAAFKRATGSTPARYRAHGGPKSGSMS